MSYEVHSACAAYHCLASVVIIQSPLIQNLIQRGVSPHLNITLRAWINNLKCCRVVALKTRLQPQSCRHPSRDCMFLTQRLLSNLRTAGIMMSPREYILPQPEKTPFPRISLPALTPYAGNTMAVSKAISRLHLQDCSGCLQMSEHLLLRGPRKTGLSRRVCHI